MTETLYPCRFCGHQPIHQVSNPHYKEQVFCPHCMISASPMMQREPEIRLSAIEIWNRRNEKNNPFIVEPAE